MTPLRCFVALWPSADARACLVDEIATIARGHPRARPVAPDNLHLTLAFIGLIDREPARAVAAALAEKHGLPQPSGAAWHLDRIGGFTGPRVAWASGDAALLAPIARQVRDLLDRLGVPFDRKPFVAHVTLARNVPSITPGPISPPIRWPIGAPRLVVSAREERCGNALRYRNFEPG